MRREVKLAMPIKADLPKFFVCVYARLANGVTPIPDIYRVVASGSNFNAECSRCVVQKMKVLVIGDTIYHAPDDAAPRLVLVKRKIQITKTITQNGDDKEIVSYIEKWCKPTEDLYNSPIFWDECPEPLMP